MSWLESLPPLIIMVAAVGAMGSLPGMVERGFNGGKDKRVQRDHFDHMMTKRDKKIKASGESLLEEKSE